jgi:hypothetical protein
VHKSLLKGVTARNGEYKKDESVIVHLKNCDIRNKIAD